MEWPLCAACGHGVERVDRYLDYFTGDVVYVVSCHGKTQRQVVPGLDLHDVTLLTTCG